MYIHTLNYIIVYSAKIDVSRKDALKPYDNHCNLLDIENKCILCEHRHTCNCILYIIVK